MTAFLVFSGGRASFSNLFSGKAVHITASRTTGLFVTYSDSRSWVQYLNLDTMSGFHHESNMPINTSRMRFVATDPWHFMLVGGWSNWVGSDRRYDIKIAKMLLNMVDLIQAFLFLFLLENRLQNKI